MARSKRKSLLGSAAAVSSVALLAACGVNQNANKPALKPVIDNPSVSGRDSTAPRESEPEFGIVGGTTISNTSWLQAMRLVRQVTSVTGSAGNIAAVNRYCAGVSLGGGVTLTASHCLNLTTNLEYDFFRYFYIADKHLCPTPPNLDGTPTCSVRPLGIVGAGLSVLSAGSSSSVSFGNNSAPTAALPVTGLRTSFYNDVGFAYTASNQTGIFPGICGTLPAVGQPVIVTGLKLVSKDSTNTNLSWTYYNAKVSRVMERLGEVSIFAPTTNTWDKYYSQSWSFETLATDTTACAERGDSGGAVFTTDPGTTGLCLLGINIAAGVAENVGTISQKCTPTTHRRITGQMLRPISFSTLSQCTLSSADPNCYNYAKPSTLEGPGAAINYSFISKAKQEFGL